MVTITLAVFISWIICNAYTNFTLANWTAESPDDQEEDKVYYMVLYSSLAILTMVIFLTRLIVIWSAGLRTAKTIFEKMLRALLDAPINKYYDVTPIGRILNRLSRD